MLSDVIGPIIALLLVFGVYYLAQRLDVLGDERKSKLDIEKIDAESKREEIAVRRRELEVKMGELAIEARKLDKLEHKPQTDAEEAEFRVLKELEEKTEDKENV